MSRIIERPRIHFRHSCKATQPPVMAAGASDQALDFLRAARLLAGRGLAARARLRGARQHRVFRRHPATALPAQPLRRLVFERGGAQHLRLAKFHKAGAFRIAGDIALQRDFPHFVGGAFGWAHVCFPETERSEIWLRGPNGKCGAPQAALPGTRSSCLRPRPLIRKRTV